MKSITKDDFLIKTTPASNAVLYWKHNRQRIQLFKSGDPIKRAIKFRDWLIRWYAHENYKMDSQRHIYQDQVKTGGD
jgi:hypothetical protein